MFKTIAEGLLGIAGFLVLEVLPKIVFIGILCVFMTPQYDPKPKDKNLPAIEQIESQEKTNEAQGETITPGASFLVHP